MTVQEHDGKRVKNGTPDINEGENNSKESRKGIPTADENEGVFTSSDPNFKDYVKSDDFTKNTGVYLQDCHAFALKELLDNTADYCEKFAEPITISVSIENTSNYYSISVKSSNPDPNRQVFPNLPEQFNYKRAFSTKSNQFSVTRGAQGDALKKLGTMPYILLNANGTSDKQWTKPFVFQHNGIVDSVYFHVDRKHNHIYPKLVQTTCDSTDIEVTLTLPPISEDNHRRLIKFFRDYVIFSTYISYTLYINHQPVIEIPAHNQVAKTQYPCMTCGFVKSNNPNSIYCYSESDFIDFLNDVYNKLMSVYNAIASFREIHQCGDGRFYKWKDITLEQLTTADSKKLFKSLRSSMMPMSRLIPPYDSSKVSRKQALLNRYLYVKRGSISVDPKKAVYRKVETSYEEDNIKFPYFFEVLAIPIVSGSEQSILISGVNYSTSITNEHYFDGLYTNTYVWKHSKTGERMQASDVEEIMRKSMAGENISNDANIPRSKQKVPCVLIAHLVSPRINYISYGKSSLRLEPFSEEIAKVIDEAINKLPSKSRYNPEDKTRSATSCLRELLQERWDYVQQTDGILEPHSINYDPWTQSTVWYHLREEYLLPLKIPIKENTRDDMTGKISEICEQLKGNPRREQLGIFASPRATMYFKGEWYNISIDDIPNLAKLGTDIVFIEKRGALEIVKYIGDDYGIAFVNTQGHFAEYPKSLITEIIRLGGRVAIITDFDCAGLHIAHRVIAQEMQDGQAVRIGIDLDTLAYFVELKVKDDKGNLLDFNAFKRKVEEPYSQAGDPKKQQPNKNVVSPIIQYARLYSDFLDDPHNPEVSGFKRYKYIYENFEYLTGLPVDIIYEDDFKPDFGAMRIEIDSLIKYVGAKAFAQFIIDKLKEHFPERNYNRAIELESDFYTDRLNTLSPNIKKLLLYIQNVMDKATGPIEKEIKSELEQFQGMLYLPLEEAEIEKRVTEVMWDHPQVKALDEKVGKFLDENGYR